MFSSTTGPAADPHSDTPAESSGLMEAFQRLRADNERLQLALAASGAVGLWDWMVDTDLLHGDANFARLYGLDPARTMAGLTMEQYQEFVVTEDLQALRRDIRATFERGADFLVEYRLAIPGQPLRWVECKGKLIANAQGQPVRFSGTAVDITLRKRDEAVTRAAAVAAREHAERMQLALAAGAIIGTWVWDIAEDAFSVDEGLADAFGLDPSVGPAGPRMARIVDAVHPDDRTGLVAAVEAAIAARGSYSCQYRVRRAHGTYDWIEANGRVESDANGRACRFPGVMVDISARRAAENERDRIAAQLRALNATLEQRIAERTAERDRMWETSPDLLPISISMVIFAGSTRPGRSCSAIFLKNWSATTSTNSSWSTTTPEQSTPMKKPPRAARRGWRTATVTRMDRCAGFPGWPHRRATSRMRPGAT